MKKLFPFALFLLLIVGLLSSCSGSSSTSSSKTNNIPEAPPCYIELKMDGEKYQEYAVEGQIWVLFKESVSQKEAEELIGIQEFKILDKYPEIGYYLLEVETGYESDIIAWINRYWDIDYAYPNALYSEQSVMPYVIDCMDRGMHGKRVAKMMEDASGKTVKTIDDTFWILEGVISSGKRNKAIISCLEQASKGNDVVINLSSGVIYNSTAKNPQEDYINSYCADLVGIVKLAYRNYFWGDFVFVKSAGNERMKRMEVILRKIRGKLSPEELNFFKDHFLLVSAQDDHKPYDYPNDISNGGYDEMISKVDISDMTAISDDWCGTSFSSPRLAGYIVRAANEYEISVSKVLPYVRKATLKSKNHVVDYEKIKAEIALYEKFKKGGYDECLTIYAHHYSLAVAINEYNIHYFEKIIIPCSEYSRLKSLCGAYYEDDIHSYLQNRFGVNGYEKLREWLMENEIHFIVKIETFYDTLGDMEDSEEYF